MSGSGKEDLYHCPICNRLHRKEFMTIHHLFPALGAKPKLEPIIYICRTCHEVIHYCHTNAELRLYWNTYDKLIKSPKIQNLLEIYKYKPDNCVFKLKKLKNTLKSLQVA